MSAPGVFVTGTDTGVGKTVVAAALVRRWGGAYWKPVQTGTATEPEDSATVAYLAPGAHVHPPRHVFAAPLSPEAAGAREGVTPSLADFTLPAGAGPLIVEGAGGVLVPLGGGATMAALMAKLGLPAVVVARTALGTINHTLLTLEALRARGIAVAGVIFAGPDNPGNRDAVAHYGGVPILGEVPPLDPLTPDALGTVLDRLPSAPPSPPSPR